MKKILYIIFAMLINMTVANAQVKCDTSTFRHINDEFICTHSDLKEMNDKLNVFIKDYSNRLRQEYLKEIQYRKENNIPNNEHFTGLQQHLDEWLKLNKQKTYECETEECIKNILNRMVSISEKMNQNNNISEIIFDSAGIKEKEKEKQKNKSISWDELIYNGKARKITKNDFDELNKFGIINPHGKYFLDNSSDEMDIFHREYSRFMRDSYILLDYIPYLPSIPIYKIFIPKDIALPFNNMGDAVFRNNSDIEIEQESYDNIHNYHVFFINASSDEVRKW